MKSIYYYFSYEANKDSIDKIKETLNKYFSFHLKENELYREIDDMVNSMRWTKIYTKPKDDEICIKVDCYNDTSIICGYSYGFVPEETENDDTKEDTTSEVEEQYAKAINAMRSYSENDDTKEDPKTFVGSYKGVFVGSALLLTGFILGKRSNKLRPLKKRDRYVEPNFLWRSYPDISYETRNAIKDEVIDFIWAFMQKNDLHFAKGRK